MPSVSGTTIPHFGLAQVERNAPCCQRMKNPTSHPSAADTAQTVARLVDALKGARAALMCYWHHSPTKIDAEIARIDAALAAQPPLADLNHALNSEIAKRDSQPPFSS